MTSGVYQLRFEDGSTYIGKSINCENRWTQHGDKFLKGTAAKAMQAAYNKNGMPYASILVKCHEDHIDVVEACLIARRNPTLNSDRPKDPYPHLNEEQLGNLFNSFQFSALDLIVHKQDLNSENKNLLEKLLEAADIIDELSTINKNLSTKRKEEDIQKDISKRIILNEALVDKGVKELEKQDLLIKQLNCTIQNQERELKYHRHSWWWKLFN